MASSPKLRSIPAEAIQDMPDWFEPVLQMLNGYLADAGNAFDALLDKANAETLETDWIEIPASKLENSCRPYGPPYAPPAYKRLASGIVLLRGEIAGSTGASSPAYTLPEGFRPRDREIFGTDSNLLHSRVDVTSDGQILIVVGAGSDISLSGIAFQAAQKRRS